MLLHQRVVHDRPVEQNGGAAILLQHRVVRDQAMEQNGGGGRVAARRRCQVRSIGSRRRRAKRQWPASRRYSSWYVPSRVPGPPRRRWNRSSKVTRPLPVPVVSSTSKTHTAGVCTIHDSGRTSVREGRRDVLPADDRFAVGPIPHAVVGPRGAECVAVTPDDRVAVLRDQLAQCRVGGRARGAAGPTLAVRSGHHRSGRASTRPRPRPRCARDRSAAPDPSSRRARRTARRGRRPEPVRRIAVALGDRRR